ncbi:MAG TPA: hypothetical protein VFV25_00105, partial [Methylibium sp.]
MGKKLAWAVISAAAVLAACGGGGGYGGGNSQPTSYSGLFVDAAAGGVGYACGSSSGVTDQKGTFQYDAGSTCTFKIGGVALGSAAGAAVITPVTLVPGATNETNPVVINITRFLLSLDSGGNTDSMITIAPSVATALASSTLDFTNATTFDAQAQALVSMAYPGRTLVAASVAQAHMGATLLGLLAGSYSCTYTGTSDSGMVTVTIANGAITGTGMSSKSGSTQ